MSPPPRSKFLPLEKAWTRYLGPEGGKGWRHDATGEVRYQSDPPEEPGSDWDARGIENKASSSGDYAAGKRFHPDQVDLRSYHPESQVAFTLTPEEFLNFAPALPLGLDRGEEDVDAWRTSEHLVERMKNGEEIDIPFLDVNVDTGKHMAHEGRHRSLAARVAGIRQIPVIIFLKNSKGEYVEPTPERLATVKDSLRRGRSVPEDVKGEESKMPTAEDTRGWPKANANMVAAARNDVDSGDTVDGAVARDALGDVSGAISYRMGMNTIDLGAGGRAIKEENVEVLSLGARPGSGAGRVLLAHVFKVAADNGLPVRLQAVDSAISYYRRAGFTEDPPGSAFFKMSAEDVKKKAQFSGHELRPHHKPLKKDEFGMGMPTEAEETAAGIHPIGQKPTKNPNASSGPSGSGKYCDDLGHCFESGGGLGGHVSKTGHPVTKHQPSATAVSWYLDDQTAYALAQAHHQGKKIKEYPYKAVTVKGPPKKWSAVYNFNPGEVEHVLAGTHPTTILALAEGSKAWIVKREDGSTQLYVLSSTSKESELNTPASTAAEQEARVHDFISAERAEKRRAKIDEVGDLWRSELGNMERTSDLDGVDGAMHVMHEVFTPLMLGHGRFSLFSPEEKGGKLDKPFRDAVEAEQRELTPGVDLEFDWAEHDLGVVSYVARVKLENAAKAYDTIEWLESIDPYSTAFKNYHVERVVHAITRWALIKRGAGPAASRNFAQNLKGWTDQERSHVGKIRYELNKGDPSSPSMKFKDFYQGYLKDRKRTSLIVFRGMSLSTEQERAVRQGNIEVALHAADSWTHSPEIASGFASKIKGLWPVVLAANVPAERVFAAYPFVGFGTEKEVAIDAREARIERMSPQEKEEFIHDDVAESDYKPNDAEDLYDEMLKVQSKQKMHGLEAGITYVKFGTLGEGEEAVKPKPEGRRASWEKEPEEEIDPDNVGLDPTDAEQDAAEEEWEKEVGGPPGPKEKSKKKGSPKKTPENP